MLWKCCTQYASKFGKLSSGHRTGKGQFSFQSQRKTISKNVQTESEEELKNLLMNVKEESENADVKPNSYKSKIMTSSPIIYWQIHGETMETVTDFIFLGWKITADGDWLHEFKRHLLLGRKAKTNLDSILKSRDITLLANVHLVKAMIFPVVMYEARRRQWHPTPVLLPGESHGQRSLAGCSP